MCSRCSGRLLQRIEAGGDLPADGISVVGGVDGLQGHLLHCREVGVRREPVLPGPAAPLTFLERPEHRHALGDLLESRLPVHLSAGGELLPRSLFAAGELIRDVLRDLLRAEGAGTIARDVASLSSASLSRPTSTPLLASSPSSKTAAAWCDWSF